MGAIVFVGYTKSKSLHVGFNRSASNAMEALISDALEKNHSELYEIIMEVIVLDQISFIELTQSEFNDAIKIIRTCIASRKHPTEGQLYQQIVWEKNIEPLIVLDPRYSL